MLKLQLRNQPERYAALTSGMVTIGRDAANGLVIEDTEVLLNSFVWWGEACLQKIHGTFAFAIWDQQGPTTLE